MRLPASPRVGLALRGGGRDREGLGPSLIISGACLVFILVASLFQRDAVVHISKEAAEQARKSYQEIRQRISFSAQADRDHHVLEALDGLDYEKGALEPEWEWAREVSVVYTWVNGSEATQRKLREKFGIGDGGERDRDNDDLRHSFRAFNKYLPWHTGTVYLVSPPGHFPYWLNLHNPRLRVINQNSLLEKDDQPSFNSNCLEAFFHRIPGLSDKFIVMNDDYFLGRQIHPRDFFTLTPSPPVRPRPKTADGEVDREHVPDTKPKERRSALDDGTDIKREIGIKMFLESRETGYAAERGGEEQWMRSVRYTAKVVREAYGQLFNERTRVTEHAPFVYDKRAFRGIHQRFNYALRKNCMHNKRHEEDAIVPFLLEQWIIQEGSRCCGIKYEIVEGQSKYFEWQLDVDRNLKKLEELFSLKPTFFNINDRMGFDSSKSEQIKIAQEQLKLVMEAWLPDPSEFELAPANPRDRL